MNVQAPRGIGKTRRRRQIDAERSEVVTSRRLVLLLEAFQLRKIDGDTLQEFVDHRQDDLRQRIVELANAHSCCCRDRFKHLVDLPARGGNVLKAVSASTERDANAVAGYRLADMRAK